MGSEIAYRHDVPYRCVKSSMTEFCIHSDWPVPPNIKAVTTLRTGGYSRKPCHSLNLGTRVDDDPEAVRQNRSLVKEKLSMPSDPVWLYQTHGKRVINAAYAGDNEEADASYADTAGIVCAVMTADCLPVLLCNPKSGFIAAIHAGWRGLLKGVVEATIETAGRDLVVWLGPAIGPNAFQVGDEVREAFVNKSRGFEPAFRPQQPGKWLADLYTIATTILNCEGIKRVYGGGYCTYSDATRFFSHRRDGRTGRMGTFIWREEG